LQTHVEVDTNTVTETKTTQIQNGIDTNTVAVSHEYGKFRALTDGRTDNTQSDNAWTWMGCDFVYILCLCSKPKVVKYTLVEFSNIAVDMFARSDHCNRQMDVQDNSSATKWPMLKLLTTP